MFDDAGTISSKRLRLTGVYFLMLPGIFKIQNGLECWVPERKGVNM